MRHPISASPCILNPANSLPRAQVAGNCQSLLIIPGQRLYGDCKSRIRVLCPKRVDTVSGEAMTSAFRHLYLRLVYTSMY